MYYTYIESLPIKLVTFVVICIKNVNSVFNTKAILTEKREKFSEVGNSSSELDIRISLLSLFSIILTSR